MFDVPTFLSVLFALCALAITCFAVAAALAYGASAMLVVLGGGLAAGAVVIIVLQANL